MFEKLSTIVFTRIFRRTSAPEWAVFATDIILATVSYILILCLTGIPVQHDLWIFTSFAHIIIYSAVYAIASLITGSFRYIVRFSAQEDMLRIFQSIFLSYLFLTAINLAIEYFYAIIYYSYSNLFLAGIISIALMISVRLCVKYLYSVFIMTLERKRRVIMLGTGIETMAVASALRADHSHDIYPVATLNINNVPKIKFINGLPVIPFDPDNISVIFREYNCDTILVLSSQINLFRASLSELFFSHNIHIMLMSKSEEMIREDGGMAKKKNNQTTTVRNLEIDELLFRAPLDNDMRNIKSELEGKSVMITGAAGSIGSELARQIASVSPSKLILIDFAETPMHDIKLEFEASKDKPETYFLIADVRNKRKMARIFTKYRPDYVFHAAAYKHVPMMEENPSEAILNNVEGTRIIADLSVEYSVNKFVLVSTDKAVNPSNVMGASKRIAEIYVQSLYNSGIKSQKGVRTEFITTRFGNVLGSNGSVIPLFRKQIAEGGPVTITDKRIIRYFMTISEACSLVLEAGCMGNGGEIYIFDMGRPVKIYDLAIRMILHAGLTPDRDIKIVETGLRPGEKLYEELLNIKERTRPTLHNKIMVAKSRYYGMEDVNNHLAILYNYAENGDSGMVVEEMKRMVPEFKSRNSQWEIIDDVLANEAENPNLSGFILNDN